MTLSDGKWHHVCATWSTRDGHWEAYQDGDLRGSGEDLAPWHPVRAGGVFVLGQEQVTTNEKDILCDELIQSTGCLGGRRDKNEAPIHSNIVPWHQYATR